MFNSAEDEMAISVGEKEIKIIKTALENAQHLITEEYQSLCDDDLKEEYERVEKNLEEALGLLKKI
jgi:hypothetical protein